jgi:hypothetical protein
VIKDSVASNMYAFIKKWEIENEMAAFIDKHATSSDIRLLTTKLDQMSDQDDLIDWEDLWNSIKNVNTEIDKSKLENLANKLEKRSDIESKIYYKHIIDELSIINEAK